MLGNVGIAPVMVTIRSARIIAIVMVTLNPLARITIVVAITARAPNIATGTIAITTVPSITGRNVPTDTGFLLTIVTAPTVTTAIHILTGIITGSTQPAFITTTDIKTATETAQMSLVWMAAPITRKTTPVAGTC